MLLSTRAILKCMKRCEERFFRFIHIIPCYCSFFLQDDDDDEDDDDDGYDVDES